MSETNIIELASKSADFDPLSDLLRSGARQLIEQAVEAELAELLAQHASKRLADGRAGVVRNGYHPERKIQTGDRAGERYNSQGSLAHRRACDVSLKPGAALCAQGEIA